MGGSLHIKEYDNFYSHYGQASIHSLFLPASLSLALLLHCPGPFLAGLQVGRKGRCYRKTKAEVITGYFSISNSSGVALALSLPWLHFL